MKLNFLVIALFIFTLSFGQNKGTVTGTITDKDMDNETLPFASVSIKGKPISANTDEAGKYTLSVPEGSHVLVIAFLGYETAEIPFTIKAGETKTIDRALASTSVQIEDVVIERTISREKESALLLEQRNAVSITQAIGAQEMSRKGVSDAEGAVTKVTGITKQQGEKNVFVRGLGDRYNSTTMNGLPLPSEDPMYKNISLEFFTSDIIKNIGVNKTFSSEIYGDVGGANIDILSKEFSGDEFMAISVSSGMNTQTVNKDFYTIDGENFFGISDKETHINDLGNYNFKNSLDPGMQSTQINSGLAVTGGKRFDIGDNALSMNLVAAMNNSYSYREGNVKQTGSTGALTQDLDFKKYVYNVAQTLMANLKYRYSDSNTISLNTLYIHDNTQDLGNYFGFNGADAFEDDLAFVRRQQTNNNNLLVNQLLAKTKISDKIVLNTDVAYNMIRTSEPDRRTTTLIYRDGTYRPNSNSAGDNERYFAVMNEDDFAGKAVATYNFNNEKNTKLDIGINARNTKRYFDATIFNHRFSNSEQVVDINNLSALFNQESLDNGIFQLQTGRSTNQSNPETFTPFWYDGKREIYAGLATFTHSFSPSLTLAVGGRFESIKQEVDYNTNIATNATFGDAIIDESYLLPNINVKYSLNENSIFRVAGSMSYTMPQFIEVAPFKYADISFSVQGNPDLVPAENYNADLKYEYYPSSDEIIAVTGFYKHIKNPINRSEIPSGGNTLTFFNTGSSAMVAGAELEIKKNIYKIEGSDTASTQVFSAGANVSYLYTEQKLEATLPSFTKENSTDQLQGASPLLVNADLTYVRSGQDIGLTSSLILNFFSDRIYAIGTRGAENVVEKGIPTLDFITQASLGKNFRISLKARNLLNPEFSLVRESAGNTSEETTLSSYKLGIDLSLGLTYKF